MGVYNCVFPDYGAVRPENRRNNSVSLIKLCECVPCKLLYKKICNSVS